MKKILSEFKTFALRGSVVDLAVGVIIGGAFQTIVNSFINDLVMPFVGLATGGINFSDQFVVLKLADGVLPGTTYASLDLAKEAGATVFAYGSFVTAVINFLIMALIIFFMVKGLNRLASGKNRKKEDVPTLPAVKTCPFCRSEISVDAVRCPHCTSDLSVAENKE